MKNLFRLGTIALGIGGLLMIKSCQSNSDSGAQTVVDKAIAYHGGNAFTYFQMEFDFRSAHYAIERNEGEFRYERVQTDSTGAEIRDILTNDEAYRTLNGARQTLPDSVMDKYKNSVNSVAYFVLLPYLLNDPAAQKKYVGETMIKGKKYDKIKVYFTPDGGGKDHEDVFVYWFDKSDHSMDYLAYLYHTNEGGMRFRAALAPQQKEGIMVQDYINYAPKDSTLAVTEENLLKLDTMYEAEALKEVSRIENKNLKVKRSKK